MFNTGVAGAKETEDVIKPDAYPLTRLGHLSDKVRRRMFARAMQEVQHAQKRSAETLEKLTFTVNLVSRASVKFLMLLTTGMSMRAWMNTFCKNIILVEILVLTSWHKNNRCF